MAVLPFENLSPDPAHEYFASGIHADIITVIAKDTDILIIGRTSVLQYVNSKKPASIIADELEVNYLLTGSILYESGQVRINMQLVDRRGIEQWSETFDKPFADIFSIQRDVAVQVANALKVSFADDEEPVEENKERKARAYQEYLVARQLRYGGLGVGDFDDAVKSIAVWNEKIYEQVNRA